VPLRIGPQATWIDTGGPLPADANAVVMIEHVQTIGELLDYKLRTMGADARRLRGYEREEFTHLTVAAAVSSGAADVGLGILAAPRALGLDFVPLLKERFDSSFRASSTRARFLDRCSRSSGEKISGGRSSRWAVTTPEMGRVVAESP
jgi:hypothetical protein